MFTLRMRLPQAQASSTQPSISKPQAIPTPRDDTPLRDRLAHHQLGYALARRLAAAKRGN